MLQAQVCIHLFQSPVFVFQLFQLLQGAGIHATVLALPLIERTFAESVLAAQLIESHSTFGFLQDVDDLRFCELALLHVATPVSYFLRSFHLFLVLFYGIIT